MDELPTRLRKETLVDLFVSRFEKLIISGKLAIGETLPSERDLAGRLGVSRPVVHEGLIDLAVKGLITRSPAGGAVVSDYRKNGSLVMLNSLLNYHDGVLEPKLALDVAAFRYLLEIENARLAARNRTTGQLEDLQNVLEVEKGLHPGDTERVAQLDFEFHLLVALATNNTVYPLLINSFKALYVSGVALFFSNPEVVPAVYTFHRQLVTAIAAQDEATAGDVMRRMLDHGMTNYLALISPG